MSDKQTADETGADDTAVTVKDCESASEASNPSIFQGWRGERAELLRRDYAKGLAAIGGVAALGSLIASLGGLSQSYTGPVYSDGIALVDGDGKRISEDRLANGEHITVFPKSRPGIDQAPTLLVRFPEDAYGGATKSEYTVAGYAAYSKLCTHYGCMVDDRAGQSFVCPCHWGEFDPLAGGAVTSGPPPRPLPQLPITLSSEGYLIATGDFEEPVGI
jgi:rieske iron-sulfur protein